MRWHSEYSIPANPEIWKDQMTWLFATFGEIGYEWDFETARFHFKNPEDATLFRLTFVA